MRAALWLLALFGVAVAIALFAGNNQGTVTLFWPPYRVDLSLNLVLLLLFLAFVFLHAALGALAALFDLPRQALRWRSQQKERAVHASLLDSISHLLAGRFIRGRKSAETALIQERSLSTGGQRLANAAQVRALAHLLAAESAQALQDRGAREEHLQQALEQGVCARRAGNARGRADAGRPLGAGRSRPRSRDGLAAAIAARRGAPHAGAAHEAEGGAAGASSRLKRWRPRACWPSTGPFRPPPPRASCADWRSTCSTGRTTWRSCSGPGLRWSPPSA